jgi:hypothetical protein
MSEFFHFGVKVARAMSTKTAAGLGGLGKSLGNMIGGAAQAAPTAKALPAPRLAPQSVMTAKPSWLRHNEAVQKGIDPATGVRPGAVAPTPPPPPPVPAAHGGMTPLQRKLYKNETGQAAPAPRTVGEFEAARGGQGPLAFQGEGALYRAGQ